MQMFSFAKGPAFLNSAKNAFCRHQPGAQARSGLMKI
jgi:hypothetical protein